VKFNAIQSFFTGVLSSVLCTLGIAAAPPPVIGGLERVRAENIAGSVRFSVFPSLSQPQVAAESLLLSKPPR
jgi:hypothetical protein